MGLFSKTEVIEVILPFKLITPTPEDREACIIDIEAYGYIDNGANKYYYASVYINNAVYDEFVDKLANLKDKRIKLITKVKNGLVKKFDIDFKDLSNKLQDGNFSKAEIVS